MVRTDDIQIFVAVVEQNGFSAAGKLLNISPAVASASVKRLEQALNAQLLVRTTRSLYLTQAGEQYLVHAKVALNAIHHGEHAVALSQGAISGNLSIALPSDLGRNFLRKAIDAFHGLHPKLNITILPNDRISDLNQLAADVIIRYGTFNHANLYVTPLVQNNYRVVCAAPTYFERHGKPQVAQDLINHNCLSLILNDAIHNKWQFTQSENVHTVAVSGNKASDDGDLLRQWAVEGKGIIYKSQLDVIDDIKEGKLEIVLKDFGTEFLPLNLMTTQHISALPAANALHIFLTYAFTAYLKPST